MSKMILVPVRSAKEMRDKGIRFGALKVGQFVLALVGILVSGLVGYGWLHGQFAIAILGGVCALALFIGSTVCFHLLDYPHSARVTLLELDEMEGMTVSREMLMEITETCLIGTKAERIGAIAAGDLLQRLQGKTTKNDHK